MMDIPMEKIEGSSNIEAAGYLHSAMTLRIQFTGGRKYDYAPVPEETWKALMSAPSKGKFFASNIKNIYGCEKVG